MIQIPYIDNGQVVKGNPKTDPAAFRATRLGDGFFETVRIIDGVPHAWEAHCDRMEACFKALAMEPQPHMTRGFIRKSVDDLLEAHRVENARLRLTFYRQGEGTYFPQTNRPGYFGELFPLSHGSFQVKEEGLHLGLYDQLPKYRGKLAPFKLMGNHVYVQASIWAQQHHFDDVLVCNEIGQIIEATSSNLFLVHNGELLTPPVRSGCVGGIMRMAVLNAALHADIPCYEVDVDTADLLGASEVFLTNAVRGISWVRSFRDKRYYHKLSDFLIGEVNKMHRSAQMPEEPQFSLGSDGK